MEKKAVIIGGSIAGLMCGIMLKHHGYTVTILEQEISNSRQGYDAGIKIGPAVQEFLQKHDRVKRDMIITCQPGVKINIEGKPKAQRGQTMVNTSWGLMMSVLRANFDGLTSEAVPVVPEDGDGDGKVLFRHGARVTGIKEIDAKMVVQFDNANNQTTETISADIAIVADGSNSAMRSILMPKVRREYLGYMCWRGTVREELVGAKWNKLYAEKGTFHLMNRNYLLNYTIPTDEGNLAPGKRLHNWVWYSNLSDGSQEMTDLFTDINGKKHLGTVPRGLLQPEAWEKQKALADAVLPEGLAAIVKKTSSPFLTKAYDVSSPKALFFGGKLFIVGDAQITLRPNIGMSTTHAANDCNNLEAVVEGTMTPEQWEKTVLRYGAAQRRFAMMITSYGLGTKLAVLWNACAWLLLLLCQKIGLL